MKNVFCFARLFVLPVVLATGFSPKAHALPPIAALFKALRYGFEVTTKNVVVSVVKGSAPHQADVFGTELFRNLKNVLSIVEMSTHQERMAWGIWRLTPDAQAIYDGKFAGLSVERLRQGVADLSELSTQLIERYPQKYSSFRVLPALKGQAIGVGLSKLILYREDNHFAGLSAFELRTRVRQLLKNGEASNFEWPKVVDELVAEQEYSNADLVEMSKALEAKFFGSTAERRLGSLLDDFIASQRQGITSESNDEVESCLNFFSRGRVYRVLAGHLESRDQTLLISGLERIVQRNLSLSLRREAFREFVSGESSSFSARARSVLSSVVEGFPQ